MNQYNPIGNNIEKAGDFDYSKYIKLILGAFLIIFGVVIAGWIFFKIIAIFDNPKTLENFLEIFPGTSSLWRIRIDNVILEIPKQLVNIIIYVIVFTLLFIAVLLVKTLITGGVNLLHSSLKRIEKKIDSIKSKVDQIRKH